VGWAEKQKRGGDHAVMGFTGWKEKNSEEKDERERVRVGFKFDR